MGKKTCITWTDADGYVCSKWVDVPADVDAERKAQIERDMAESMERQSRLIFGKTWEQIQSMQQKRN